jgi:hypothetical protein
MSRLLLITAALVLTLAPADGRDEKDATYVKLVHADTGKVLAVEDDSTEAGAQTVLAKDDGSEGQQWKLEKDGDHLKIVNRKSGKVLDVFEASQEEGTKIIIWDEKAEDTDNQRWAWVGDGKERRLKSKHSSLVLDVDGSRVIQKKADAKAKGQLWRVVEAKK